MEGIREYLEATDTPAIEFDGYVAERRTRPAKVRGQKKEQKFQQAVEFYRSCAPSSLNLTHDPRSVVEEISKRLAGDREERTSIRIAKKK